MSKSRNSRTVRTAIMVVVLMLLVTAGAALAGPGATALGQAGDYSEFIFGNATRMGGSTANSGAAYGGNADLTNFTNFAPVNDNGIIVEGDYDHLGGEANGNVIVNGTVGLTTTINNGTLQNGSVIDFAAAKVYYQNFSNAWAAAQPAETVTGCPLMLEADDLKIGVFNVSAADLSSCGSVEIDTISEYTGVIINVSGSSADLSDLTVDTNGSSSEAILWNMSDATSVTINDTTIPGNILAPNAAVSAEDAALEGVLIADSLVGDNFDTGYAPFCPKFVTDLGDLPSIYNSTLVGDPGTAIHVLGDSWLGAIVDNEADGQESDAATGDDNTGSPNDEDGIVTDIDDWSELTGGSITATVSGSDSCLNAWIDFNKDGDMSDASEHIIVNQMVMTGENVIDFDIPADSLTGNLYARYRLSDKVDGECAPVSPSGVIIGGEVEDYLYIFSDQTAVTMSNAGVQSASSIAPVLLIALTLLAGTAVIVRKES